MRDRILFALLAMSGLGLAVACSQAAPAPAATQAPASARTAEARTQAPAPPSQPTGHLRIGISDLPPNGDPYVLGNVGPWAYWGHQVFDGLTMIEDQGQRLAPRLARSWRMLDPTTWEVVLADAKFHDGSTVTTADVAWTIQKVQDPSYQRGISPRLLGLTSEIVDAKTIRIKSRAPEVFMDRLWIAVDIQPRAYYERVGPEGFSTKPVGTGPFQVVEFQPKNKVIMRAFPESFRGAPRAAELTFFNMGDTAVRIAALQTGEIDIASDVPPDQAVQVRARGFQVVDTYGTSHFRWMMPPDGVTEKTQVRQALNYAVDKEAIVRSIFAGFGAVLPGQLMGRATFGFNPEVQAYPYDPNRARQLLAQAGFPNGIRVELKYTATTLGAADVALITADHMRRAGVTAELRQQEPAILVVEVRDVEKRQGSLYMLGGGGNDFDGLSAMIQHLSTDGRRLYRNPEFDRLVGAAAVELDIRRREQLLKDAARIMRDDPPGIFLYYTPQIYAYSPKVQGFKFHDTSRYFLETVWLQG